MRSHPAKTIDFNKIEAVTWHLTQIKSFSFNGIGIAAVLEGAVWEFPVAGGDHEHP
jgi:hypothetical protein